MHLRILYTICGRNCKEIKSVEGFKEQNDLERYSMSYINNTECLDWSFKKKDSHLNLQVLLIYMAAPARLERTAYRLGGGRSILLSYGAKKRFYNPYGAGRQGLFQLGGCRRSPLQPSSSTFSKGCFSSRIFLSLSRLLASIWRIRSRVTPNFWPMVSSV